MEDLAVVLGAGVELADGFDEGAEGYAAAVVADGDLALGEIDGHVDALAEAGGELVDGVVDDLFDEDVYAVVVGGAVAELADIHAGAETDVLHVFEVYNAAFVVVSGVAEG